MKKFFFLIFIYCFLLINCGGGGGGGTTSSSDSNYVIVTGEWGGTYSSNLTSTHAIVLNIQNNSPIVTGTFSTGTNISGTVNGSVSGNTISFTLTSTTPSCLGSYSGTGTINNDTITFNFTGTDCVGTHNNGQGAVSKFTTQNTIGWSGNWWVDDVFRIIFLTLSTTDSENYSGNVKFINKQDGSILTANLNGQYGWGQHPSLCSSPTDYNWMLMGLENIQGHLDANDNILSGQGIFKDYTTDLIRISEWCFQVQGGATILSGAWFKKIR